jgi:hypothetical protein
MIASVRSAVCDSASQLADEAIAAFWWTYGRPPTSTNDQKQVRQIATKIHESQQQEKQDQ